MTKVNNDRNTQIVDWQDRKNRTDRNPLEQKMLDAFNGGAKERQMQRTDGTKNLTLDVVKPRDPTGKETERKGNEIHAKATGKDHGPSP